MNSIIILIKALATEQKCEPSNILIDLIYALDISKDDMEDIVRFMDCDDPQLKDITDQRN